MKLRASPKNERHNQHKILNQKRVIMYDIPDYSRWIYACHSLSIPADYKATE